jgi:shikimate dehydrogenase
LGDPVAHSRSPAMHRAAFAALGLPHGYFAFHVPAEALAAAVQGARALGFGGLNVTVPHKQAVTVHVDRLDPVAQRIGAVNTIVFESTDAVGHSTDGAGFLAAVDELGARAPVRAVVLGGGGAARSIVDALVHRDPALRVVWVSRRPRELPLGVGVGVESAGYDDLDRAFDGADLLVNATTVGMHGGPEHFGVPLPLQRLAPASAVVDIVYPRRPGGLLDAAEQSGARVQDGLPMLLWQGVYALRLWLGHDVPAHAVAAMRAALADDA